MNTLCIYNNSIKDLSEIFFNLYNIEKTDFYDNYKQNEKNKTKYAKFVKNMHDTEDIKNLKTIQEKSNEISKKWKNEKDKKELINNNENIKIENKNETDDKIRQNDFELKIITIDNNEYYIDSYNNIIELENGKGNYIGYINEENKYIFN
jgi:hypothetical protein